MEQNTFLEAGVPRLSAAGVGKTYGTIRALSDVRFEVRPGELHGLVGQNGSGKSTLIKVFTGYHAPDPGADIRVDGTEVALPITAVERRRHGISVVHQSLGLVADMSVTHNVRIESHEVSRWSRRIDWRRERERTREALEKLGARIDPTARVKDLSVEERTTVAIARAMQNHRPGAGLIVFDESTRPLTKDALDRFYDVLRGVLDSGTSVLMISHRLEEVLQHTDRISVLRDGRLVERGIPTDELEERDLVAAMLGRQFESLSHAKRTLDAPVEMTGVHVDRLTGDSVCGLSFAIEPGEIVGITGLTGSGFEEVPYLLSGAKRAAAGTLTVGAWSADLTKSNVRTMIDRRVALVPEERSERGVAVDQTIEQNITLPRLRSRGHVLWTGRRWRADEVRRMTSALDVRPPLGDTVVGTLSGGNQQKVLLAKWFASAPELLLMHEPAQAVDVGARADIVRATFDLAESGASVLVAASDPGDLAAMCHRVLVVHDGELVAELSGDFDQDAIVHATFARSAQTRAKRPASEPAERSTT